MELSATIPLGGRYSAIIWRYSFPESKRLLWRLPRVEVDHKPILPVLSIKIANSSGSAMSILVSLPNPSAIIAGGLLALAIVFLIYLLVEAFFLWVAGEVVVGRRVTYGEAIGIAFFGTVILVGVILFLGASLLGLGLALLLFLLIVKKFFHTGWLKAIGVSIVSILIAFVILFILVLVGITILGSGLGSLGLIVLGIA